MVLVVYTAKVIKGLGKAHPGLPGGKESNSQTPAFRRVCVYSVSLASKACAADGLPTGKVGMGH